MPPLAIGTQVWRKNMSKANKAAPRYLGPYLVKGINPAGNYIIADASGNVHPHALPIGQLKPVAKVKGSTTQLIVDRVLDVQRDAIRGLLYKCKIAGADQVRVLEYNQIANPDVIAIKVKLSLKKAMENEKFENKEMIKRNAESIASVLISLFKGGAVSGPSGKAIR